MQPNVTLVLPVYNVESYLRQCLDSVVNQTMREIQIICVNDGSSDILEEYATKDSRIMIIHQENQGAGSARNAAFPHIQGKYTYFVDPDDWIDVQLCEKLFKYAEENKAEIVYLNAHCVNEFGVQMSHREKNFKQYDSSHLKFFTLNKNLSLFERKNSLLSIDATCRKFWNSNFLLDNQITFAAGKRPCNDVLQNWKGVVYAQKIEILTDKLYYRRIRPGSYQMNKNNNSKLIVFHVCSEIKKFLLLSGYYDHYQKYFFTQKIRRIFRVYALCPKNLRKIVFEMALDIFDDDERDFCYRSNLFSRGVIFGRRIFAKKQKKFFHYVFFSVLLLLYTNLFLLAFRIKKMV